MSEPTWTRRGLLARGALGMAVVGAGTLVGRRAAGANERLSIGIVGCGSRGTALMNQIHGHARAHNVEIRAVCDVWRPNLERAVARVKKGFGETPHRSTRFGDLLDRKDVDAVVIATPDFGHARILIAALEAGKDVYVEKPMSLDIAEANLALDLARRTRRVVQAGTQRRSDGAHRAAAKMLSTDLLGPVSRVSAAVCFNQPRWARDFSDCKETDVDWQAYLFNRPMRPFDPRLLRRWHFYRDFTNGLSGLWMSHYVDAVHLLTGASYPSSAVAHGDTYVWKDGREHCDNFHALFDYHGRFLFDWAMSLTNSCGGHFTLHGSKGTLDAETWTVSPAGGLSGTTVTTRKVPAEANQSHMGNWLECLRSRRKPNADIQYGHQHAVATIMAADALHTGRRLKYDTEGREAYPA